MNDIMNESSPGYFTIEIRNCNSIAEARISIRRSALNIKFGPNGVGKSTIARALSLHTQGDAELSQLLPFKHRKESSNVRPTVTGAEEIEKILVFDEEFVSRFAFQQDEVLKNSFEVFINTEEYQKGMTEIGSLFDELKDSFTQQTEFDEALQAFTQLRDAFSVTKSGAVAKTSRGIKAIGMSKKIANIPDNLQGYEEFLHSDDPASWISWHSKGKSFVEISENCPFCSGADVDKETVRQVSEEFESAAVKNLTALRSIIDDLGKYFEDSYNRRLGEILTSVGDLSPEQNQFLAGIRGQVHALLEKLTNLRSLSFHTLRDVKDVSIVLADLKIDLTLLDALASPETEAVVRLINGKLDGVSTRINDVRAEIGKQNSRVAKLVRDNQASINQFLQSAGYRYMVRIEPTAESYRMILEHEDLIGHLESAAQHLSYGERNAFALVLFMHYVRSVRPSLVILDDPVSSFDKTKKFAILYQLFHGKNSIRDFTTLFLTHDIEPAIDSVLNPTSAQFRAIAHFLRVESGVVSEKKIERQHISTFSQVCDENIRLATEDVIKCIYLRRQYEMNGNLGLEYDILSSILHLRQTPSLKGDDGELTPLTQDQINEGMKVIQGRIPDLDYNAIVRDLSDPVQLKAKFDGTNVGYEKIQLFRVMLTKDPEADTGDNAFKKFVNESYHIENEYVMQLNPRQFDAVPEYVVHECQVLIDQDTNPATSQ